MVAPAAGVYSLNGLGQIVAQSGTSFAAPLVTGIAGLLLSFDGRLTADSLKALILAGAVQSGTVAGGVPAANAHESLKLAAERPGAPICGNRVFLKGDGVFVQRGNAGPEERIVTMAGADGLGSVSTYHGGRFLEANGTWEWVNGVWMPGATVPFDFQHSASGSTVGRPFASGNSPVSHDADSAAFEWVTSYGPPDVFDLRLGLLSDPTQNRLLASFTGQVVNNAISIPSVGPELVVGVFQGDAAGSWDIYGVNMSTGVTRSLFSRTGVADMIPSFSEDGKEFSISSYRFDGQCVTEFFSAATGTTVRTPVAYPWNLGACRANAVWGANRRPAVTLRRH